MDAHLSETTRTERVAGRKASSMLSSERTLGRPLVAVPYIPHGETKPWNVERTATGIVRTPSQELARNRNGPLSDLSSRLGPLTETETASVLQYAILRGERQTAASLTTQPRVVEIENPAKGISGRRRERVSAFDLAHAGSSTLLQSRAMKHNDR
jgi:hypothetical protein